jgi:serine/threonine protein kinase
LALNSGTRLGPYEISALLGKGGMGEVYRARDTKLDRHVAIKVLPETFTSDPDRRARFQREAKVLASLNHQNIAHIHGYEESGGVDALVMELVEGPTLADRIAQGPITVDEALSIARNRGGARIGARPCDRASRPQAGEHRFGPTGRSKCWTWAGEGD